MTLDNALHSFTARSVSFDVNTMTLTVLKARYTLTEAQARLADAICVRYMRERLTVYSALQSARRHHTDIERKRHISNCIKDYERSVNERMRNELFSSINLK